VGRRINAAGQTGNHDQILGAQLGGDPAGEFQADGAGVPRPDDADARASPGRASSAASALAKRSSRRRKVMGPTLWQRASLRRAKRSAGVSPILPTSSMPSLWHKLQDCQLRVVRKFCYSAFLPPMRGSLPW
jgi:hypothetical protein